MRSNLLKAGIFCLVTLMSWNVGAQILKDGVTPEAAAKAFVEKRNREFEEKSKDRTEKEQQDINVEFMQIFVEFGKMLDRKPEDTVVQQQVQKLKDYITEHFYTCTNQILRGLGQMYAGGGSMTENIDKAGGKGTAEFAAQAIEIYCKPA